MSGRATRSGKAFGCEPRILGHAIAALAEPAAPTAQAAPTASVLAALVLSAPAAGGRDRDPNSDSDSQSVLESLPDPDSDLPDRAKMQTKTRSPPCLQNAPLLAHFHVLPDEVQNALLLFTKSLADQSERTKRRLEQRKPVPTHEEALSYIPSNPPGWTPDEEALLQQQWAGSPERQALARPPKHLIPLWKFMLRMFHTAPSCFVSAQNCLQYNVKLADGVTIDPNWDKSFCERLRKLACHSIFRGRLELLHLALLWVPICRQDFRGTIQWRNTTSDALLTRLMRAMADNDGSWTIVEVHEHVSSTSGDHGSAMSDLLKGIEKRAFRLKAPDQPIFRPRVVEPLEISNADLKVVKLAANAVQGGLGMAAFYPTSLSQRVLITSMASYSYPYTKAELLAVREAAALSVLRFKARRDAAVREYLERDPTPMDLESSSSSSSFSSDHMEIDEGGGGFLGDDIYSPFVDSPVRSPGSVPRVAPRVVPRVVPGVVPPVPPLNPPPGIPLPMGLRKHRVVVPADGTVHFHFEVDAELTGRQEVSLPHTTVRTGNNIESSTGKLTMTKQFARKVPLRWAIHIHRLYSY
ncbi:hypothetical protein PG984_011981 [Apiospora sp. TS-2023a]